MIDGFRVIDLHVHSELSGCADKPPGYKAELVLRHAAKLGIDGLAFTDHVLEPQAALSAELIAELGGRPGLERQRKLRASLAGLDPSGLPSFRVGAEVDVFAPGLFAVTPEGRRELDLAAMSANHPQLAGTPAPESAEPEAVARHILEKTRLAVRSGLATSLAHPLIPMGRPRAAEAYALYPGLGVEELFEEARDAGVILGFSRHLLVSQHLARQKDAAALYALAVKVGVKLAFETDCHQLWHMSCIVAMIEFARKLGLAPGNFITDLP
jgi:histidinol phosphatase-like PHP family hydrolase